MTNLTPVVRSLLSLPILKMDLWLLVPLMVSIMTRLFSEIKVIKLECTSSSLVWPPIAAFISPMLCLIIGVLLRKKRNSLKLVLDYLNYRDIYLVYYSCMDPFTSLLDTSSFCPSSAALLAGDPYNYTRCLIILALLASPGELTNVRLVYLACVGHVQWQVVSFLLKNNLFSDWEPLFYLFHMFICCTTVFVHFISIRALLQYLRHLGHLIPRKVHRPVEPVPSLVLTKEFKEINDSHDSKYYLRMYWCCCCIVLVLVLHLPVYTN